MSAAGGAARGRQRQPQLPACGQVAPWPHGSPSSPLLAGAACAEKIFSTWADPQAAQWGVSRSAVTPTRNSETLPHSAHWYSKIGMIGLLQLAIELVEPPFYSRWR